MARLDFRGLGGCGHHGILQLTSIDVLIHEEEGPEREALMVKGRIF